MPRWSDIQPKKVARQLVLILSYTYDPVQDAFTGRLAGDRIATIFEHGFRGLPMAEAFPDHEYPRPFAKCKCVITEPAFYHGRGMVFRDMGRVEQGERIMMPLATADAPDGILGATDCPMDFFGHKPQIDCDNEVSSWFSL